jgi:hypothetical protein
MRNGPAVASAAVEVAMEEVLEVEVEVTDVAEVTDEVEVAVDVVELV